MRFAGSGGLDNLWDVDEMRGLGPNSQAGGGSKSTDLHGGSPAVAEDRHAAQFNSDTQGSDRSCWELEQNKW
jgi:hypothetical protein